MVKKPRHGMAISKHRSGSGNGKTVIAVASSISMCDNDAITSESETYMAWRQHRGQHVKKSEWHAQHDISVSTTNGVARSAGENGYREKAKKRKQQAASGASV